MFKRKTQNKEDWVAKLGQSSRIPFGMFDMIVASLFINVLSLAMPLSLLQIYDRILPNNTMNTLILLIGGIAVAVILEALLKVGRSYLSGWVGARFEHLSGCASLERILSTSVNDFEKEGSGVHLERINALGDLKEFYSGQAIMTLFDLPFAIIFLALISYLAGGLVWVPIVIITIFALNAWRVGTLLRAALAERMIADERRFNFIIEVLRGIHTLKSMAMETQMLRRYERLQESCAKTDYDVTLHSSSAMNLGALYSQITMFAVVGVGSTFVIDGQLTVGGLAACTMLSGRSMQPLQRAVGIWARFQTIQLARAKMREIFELHPESASGLPVVGGEFQGHIELNDIELSFDEEQPPLFSGVNLKVKPGEIIGITGGNASGKSSLLYIMMGAMRATKGSVLIDGQDLNELDPASVRRKIAYLPQHGVLFNGTILDNLTMFKPELEEKALKIARLLGLDEVVARMPLGYETTVGNGAYDSIPRGIKQRIAIGRALMSDPAVLLFDEANAAMDSAGDQVLMDFLTQARGRRTLVLVSHRPSVLRMADRVYDLVDGSFTERPQDPAPKPVGQQPTPPKPVAAPVPPMQDTPVEPTAPEVMEQSEATQTIVDPVVEVQATQNTTEMADKKAPEAAQKVEPNVELTKGEAAKPKEQDSPAENTVKSVRSKVKVVPPKESKEAKTQEPEKENKPRFVLKKRKKKKEGEADG